VSRHEFVSHKLVPSSGHTELSVPHPVRLRPTRADKAWEEVGLWLTVITVLVTVAGLVLGVFGGVWLAGQLQL